MKASHFAPRWRMAVLIKPTCCILRTKKNYQRDWSHRFLVKYKQFWAAAILSPHCRRQISQRTAARFLSQAVNYHQPFEKLKLKKRILSYWLFLLNDTYKSIKKIIVVKSKGEDILIDTAKNKKYWGKKLDPETMSY